MKKQNKKQNKNWDTNSKEFWEEIHQYNQKILSQYPKRNPKK